jgi:hypothetical protein
VPAGLLPPPHEIDKAIGHLARARVEQGSLTPAGVKDRLVAYRGAFAEAEAGLVRFPLGREGERLRAARLLTGVAQAGSHELQGLIDERQHPARSGDLSRHSHPPSPDAPFLLAQVAGPSGTVDASLAALEALGVFDERPVTRGVAEVFLG